MKTIKIFLAAVFAAGISTASAQGDVQDSRVVGIVAFSSGSLQDSLAAKDVNLTAAKVLVQTQRFTILDVSEWKKTQEEIDRQKDAAFMEQDIIQKGKSLGAKVLVIGTVKNAEIRQDGAHYAARVDYDVKFVDVATTKSIAANSFTGDSENMNNKEEKVGRGLEKMARASLGTGRGNWKKMYLTSAAFSAMSEAEKNFITGKMIDAIDATAHSLNAWIRETFSINLLCLEASDEDSKKGFQTLLIAGGDDIGLAKGDKLRLVLISQISTSRGTVQDEKPVADLEVDDVRAQTSQCKVVSGGKNISADKDQVAKYRVVFKIKK